VCSAHRGRLDGRQGQGEDPPVPSQAAPDPRRSDAPAHPARGQPLSAPEVLPRPGENMNAITHAGTHYVSLSEHIRVYKAISDCLHEAGFTFHEYDENIDEHRRNKQDWKGKHWYEWKGPACNWRGE